MKKPDYSNLKNVKLFSVKQPKNPDSSPYMRPEIDEKSPVAKITVELRDGTTFQLDNNTSLYINDPREDVKSLVAKGIISAEQGAERLEKIPHYVLKTVTVSRK